MKLIKEWLLNILLKISMPHFYAAEPFKKHMRITGKKHSLDCISFQTVHPRSSFAGAEVLDIICAGRGDRGVSWESVLVLFVPLCARIHFLVSSTRYSIWRTLQFFACGLFPLPIAVILHNYGGGIRLLFLFYCASHDSPSRMKTLLFKD